MKIQVELTKQEVAALKDALLNTYIQSADDGDDDYAFLLQDVNKKLFGVAMKG